MIGKRDEWCGPWGVPRPQHGIRYGLSIRATDLPLSGAKVLVERNVLQWHRLKVVDVDPSITKFRFLMRWDQLVNSSPDDSKAFDG